MDGAYSLTLVRIQELLLIQMWSVVPDKMECGNKINLNVHIFFPIFIHSRECYWEATLCQALCKVLGF